MKKATLGNVWYKMHALLQCTVPHHGRVTVQLHHFEWDSNVPPAPSCVTAHHNTVQCAAQNIQHFCCCVLRCITTYACPSVSHWTKREQDALWCETSRRSRNRGRYQQITPFPEQVSLGLITFLQTGGLLGHRSPNFLNNGPVYFGQWK